MPRTVRKQSESGIHHVMARGIEQRDLFHDDQDRIKYLNKLTVVIDEHQCKLHAYCLMSNHVHLLISEGIEPLGRTMHRISTAYAFWYNTKYGRKGHLFQDRFKSEPVEDDAYFLTVMRYIHHNPVKAGLSPDCFLYRWSSYNAYATGNDSVKLTDQRLGLSILGNRTQLLKFHGIPNSDQCLDITDDERNSDGEILDALQLLLNSQPTETIRDMNSQSRTQLIKQLRTVAPGVRIRQLARLTGLAKSTVARAWDELSD